MPTALWVIYWRSEELTKSSNETEEYSRVAVAAVASHRDVAGGEYRCDVIEYYKSQQRLASSSNILCKRVIADVTIKWLQLYGFNPS